MQTPTERMKELEERIEGAVRAQRITEADGLYLKQFMKGGNVPTQWEHDEARRIVNLINQT